MFPKVGLANSKLSVKELGLFLIGQFFQSGNFCDAAFSKSVYGAFSKHC
jgi:hypothetical protein